MGVLLFKKYHLDMSCLNEKEKKEKKEGGTKRKRKKQKDSNQSIPNDLNENGEEQELQTY